MSVDLLLLSFFSFFFLVIVPFETLEQVRNNCFYLCFSQAFVVDVSVTEIIILIYSSNHVKFPLAVCFMQSHAESERLIELCWCLVTGAEPDKKQFTEITNDKAKIMINIYTSIFFLGGLSQSRSADWMEASLQRRYFYVQFRRKCQKVDCRVSKLGLQSQVRAPLNLIITS